MVVEITSEEKELVLELLSAEMDELGPEIHHTDDHDYRDDLKDRRDVVRRLTERLAQPVAG